MNQNYICVFTLIEHRVNFFDGVNIVHTPLYKRLYKRCKNISGCLQPPRVARFVRSVWLHEQHPLLGTAHSKAACWRQGLASLRLRLLYHKKAAVSRTIVPLDENIFVPYGANRRQILRNEALKK